SIFIVIGGLIASLLINFKMSQIKLTGRVLKEAFRQKDLELLKLIQLFINLSERARREGLLALENEAEEIEDPFIKKGMLLAVDGIEPEVIQEILDAEITSMEERHSQGRLRSEERRVGTEEELWRWT